jgi:ornithine cyclodeaminase/alanine dehydrogenase-like protein (mu-crystallin family)
VEARTPKGALLLSRSDVERLLTPDACIAAVEDAFRQYALGTRSASSRRPESSACTVRTFRTTAPAMACRRSRASSSSVMRPAACRSP